MWNIKAQPSLTVYGSRGGYVCIEQQPEAGVCNQRCVVAIHPDALGQVIERMQAASAGLRSPDVSAVKLRLPRDLKAALHPTRPRRLKVLAALDVYGTDIIELPPLRDLKVAALKVRPQFGGLSAEDPHRGEDGYYAVPAVNLVRRPADHALLWLPTERRYGTYDPEHTTLMAFPPKLTWTKLRANIERYFAATNSGGGIEDPELAEYVRPWPAHSFVAGD